MRQNWRLVHRPHAKNVVCTQKHEEGDSHA